MGVFKVPSFTENPQCHLNRYFSITYLHFVIVQFLSCGECTFLVRDYLFDQIILFFFFFYIGKISGDTIQHPGEPEQIYEVVFAEAVTTK